MGANQGIVMTKEKIAATNRNFEAEKRLKLDMTAVDQRYIKTKTARAWTKYLAAAKAKSDK